MIWLVWSIFLLLAVAGYMSERKRRLEEDKKILERFEHSLRRVKAGLEPLSIQEIYGIERVDK